MPSSLARGPHWQLAPQQSLQKPQQVLDSAQQLLSAVSRLYRFLETRHPLKTAECVAAEIDVSAEAVRKWARGDGTPSFPVLMKLFRRYGPQALAVMWGDDAAPDWVAAAADRAELAELRAMGAQFIERLDRLEARGT